MLCFQKVIYGLRFGHLFLISCNVVIYDIHANRNNLAISTGLALQLLLI